MSSDLGLIGLAVMGQNLVLNMDRNGARVSVYNRTAAKTTEFIKGPASGTGVQATYSLEELAGSLQPPRRIMLMVQAGKAVDAVIDQLAPLLAPGDLIIDGGNSYFQDTERRSAALEARGLRYLGVGVSGGEEGALWGPSIMPGGQPDAYKLVQDAAMKTWEVKHAGRDDADFVRQLKTDPAVAKHFKKGELEELCSLDFHFKEVKNRFKKLGL